MRLNQRFVIESEVVSGSQLPKQEFLKLLQWNFDNMSTLDWLVLNQLQFQHCVFTYGVIDI